MMIEGQVGFQSPAGEIACAILRAPKTRWEEVDHRTVAYLKKNVVGNPWFDHLALAATVLTARRRDARTVLDVVQVVHSRLRSLLPALGLQTLEQWRPEEHILAYLKGEVLQDHTQTQRKDFWGRYHSASKHVFQWLQALPEAERGIYRAWTLPTLDPAQV